jgi:LysM repeat protein
MRTAKWVLVVLVLVALLGVQFAAAAPAHASSAVHIVKRGENLYRIARRYGTSVQAIAAANHIPNPNRIYVGQRLIIPSGSGPVPGGRTIHVVRCGETLSGIAFRYGVNMWAIVQANGIRNPNCIYVGQRLVIPYGGSSRGGGCASCGTYYTVRCGDTLSGIAWRFGVNMWAIANANGLRNPNCIYAGQRLYIP